MQLIWQRMGVLNRKEYVYVESLIKFGSYNILFATGKQENLECMRKGKLFVDLKL